jgi:mRNA-degrading endonuclease RelE of RelBE toxin-antitoxin system
MTYLVRLSKPSKAHLLILDKSVREPLYRKIKRLSNSPSLQGKPLNHKYRELKHDKFRVYYFVVEGEVHIENIFYEGEVHVEKIGHKKSQHRDIASLD